LGDLGEIIENLILYPIREVSVILFALMFSKGRTAMLFSAGATSTLRWFK